MAIKSETTQLQNRKSTERHAFFSMPRGFRHSAVEGWVCRGRGESDGQMTAPILCPPCCLPPGSWDTSTKDIFPHGSSLLPL